MAALKIRVCVPPVRVEASICGATIQRIVEEVCSPLNRYGAQCTFSVHDPTPEQLVRQHMETGGMQRCIDAMGAPSASIVH